MPPSAPFNAAEQTARFEQLALPHLHSAWQLARWLARNDAQAQEVVQEAWLRAWRYFGGFSGTVEDARAWLLAIVRNAFYDSLAAQRPNDVLDEEGSEAIDWTFNPEQLAERADAKRMLEAALRLLPVAYREMLVLRELAGCSYEEIANMTGLPPGTVMSRLARARAQLAQILQGTTR
ncbi:sigma-70 family RNA polymerase sigma factor [Amantichitinum ursilacus]|nr:sigma-70 family RNA polymerase sigma factor [Amantichitinum ursilacus]